MGVGLSAGGINLNRLPGLCYSSAQRGVARGVAVFSVFLQIIVITFSIA